jgi:flagellar secretion chaperone FliS
VSPSPQAYQNQQIMTATPAQLVTMLYERAILSLKTAVRSIEAGDIEARFNANKQAGDIITHLCTTLDAERGGEIAANLSQLYRYMLGRLTFVDVRNDPDPAREVIALLEPLRESWAALARRAEPSGATRPAESIAGALASGFSISA